MSDKELLFSVTRKDFILQPFKASGPGGQHRNKNATAIRIIHPESGARGECKEFKSQRQNRNMAFKRLLESKEWKLWHRLKRAELERGRAEIEALLERWMRPENFKIEVWDSKLKRYVEVKDE